MNKVTKVHIPREVTIHYLDGTITRTIDGITVHKIKPITRHSTIII